jgi:hypothetical protein
MNTPHLKEQQLRKIRTQAGFIAALDQSGGSTPKALRSYGIKEHAWSNEEEMFSLVHQMRARLEGSTCQRGSAPGAQGGAFQCPVSAIPACSPTGGSWPHAAGRQPCLPWN